MLMENMASKNVHRSVKPQILCLVTVSLLLVESLTNKYIEVSVVLNMFQQAYQSQLNKSDFDIVDYLNELREGCLEADTVIIQRLKRTTYPDVLLMQPEVKFSFSLTSLLDWRIIQKAQVLVLLT